ncbi:MAG: hypothetical protein J7L23_02330 [Candidatus Diapherotrites archaeon]|nr:hypothetical protein [Candidatus Diapherotrites archaeon]
MRKIIAFLILLTATSMALNITFIEPSNTTYSYGEIPIKIEVSNHTDLGNISSVSFELKRGNVVLQTKDATEEGEVYASSFTIETAGEYEVKATVKFDNDGGITQQSNTTTFEVNSSKMSIILTSPRNITYAYSPEIKLSVDAGGVFIHDVKVTATIYSNGSKLSELNVPEGRNYYRQSTNLTAGFYRMELTASKGSQTVSTDVEFTITGEVNGTFIPGNKLLNIVRISPASSKFELGSKTKIEVQLIDISTGGKLRRSDADVEAKVITPSETKNIKLAFDDDISNPSYSAPLLLNERGWYEIFLETHLKGYENASLHFPPIKVGKEAVVLPADMGCAQGICMKIKSPKANEIFPINETIGLSVQLLEDDEEHTPISDAKVTASAGSENVVLDYQKNGEYYAEIGPLEEGNYDLTIAADWKNVGVTNTSSFTVSPNQLHIVPVFPVQDENITEKSITVQVDVLDQADDVVAGVNVRAIITTPSGFSHDLKLKRNAETGHYEAKFTFADTGNHSVKLTAMEPGYVSATKDFSFSHCEKEEQLLSTGQDELLLIVIIVGIVLVLLAIWKAFL